MTRVRLDKSGLDRVRKALKKANGLAVKVGVLGAEGSDLQTIAAANEFGTETIPERSFLRSTFSANQAKYAKGLAKGLEAVIDDRLTPERALALVGLEAVKDVQKTMTDLEDPPNADSTIQKKGSSNPLIDTGRLRQSITYDVVKRDPGDQS